MSETGGVTPLQRRLLWGLLTAVMLAIVVTWMMAPRWRGSIAAEPPPILGQAPRFELLNRDDRTVSNDDLLGHPWVADFIFTRCALSCPRMTSRMIELGRLLPPGSQVARVSFSVDPTYDTPEVLQQYAESWRIEDPQWLFLTGARETLYSLVSEGFHLALDTNPPPEAASPQESILHSTRFVLVDAEGAIRGYYDVVQGEELARLSDDLWALTESR